MANHRLSGLGSWESVFILNVPRFSYFTDVLYVAAGSCVIYSEDIAYHVLYLTGSDVYVLHDAVPHCLSRTVGKDRHSGEQQ